MDFLIFAGLLALLSSPEGLLILSILLGLIPAGIAWRKGRSFWGFFVYGALVFVVALPHAIFARPNLERLEARQLASGDHRRCPHCAEIIRVEARACRFCGRDVEKEPLLLVKSA